VKNLNVCGFFTNIFLAIFSKISIFVLQKETLDFWISTRKLWVGPCEHYFCKNCIEGRVLGVPERNIFFSSKTFLYFFFFRILKFEICFFRNSNSKFCEISAPIHSNGRCSIKSGSELLSRMSYPIFIGRFKPAKSIYEKHAGKHSVKMSVFWLPGNRWIRNV